MHIGRQIDCCEYYIRGSKLVEETLEKDLGVRISADMKCSQQCRYAVNKANKVLSMIKRTITYKHLKIMLKLYKTLVRPHVEYCVSAWCPYYINQSINQSWIYIAHKRKASNALVRYI